MNKEGAEYGLGGVDVGQQDLNAQQKGTDGQCKAIGSYSIFLSRGITVKSLCI